MMASHNDLALRRSMAVSERRPSSGISCEWCAVRSATGVRASRAAVSPTSEPSSK